MLDLPQSYSWLPSLSQGGGGFEASPWIPWSDVLGLSPVGCFQLLDVAWETSGVEIT